jgi:hypothetical protein
MHNQNVCVGIRHYTVISAILDRGKLRGNQNFLLKTFRHIDMSKIVFHPRYHEKQ